jgi:hypothetical protein
VRRVVTGVDARGRSTIASDAPGEYTMPLKGIPTFRLTELWKTATMPVDLADGVGDRCGLPIELAPLAHGTTLRFLEFPPDADWRGRADAAEAFGTMGASGSASLAAASERHEMMHATDTLDYIVILKGEIWAVFDATETRLVAGDVLIQRGTNHAWSNRSTEPCLMIAVLVDAVAGSRARVR